jgi:predicted membrane protein
MVGPVAIVTALPTAITTYSSLFLLAGLLAMTIAADQGSNIQQHMTAFKAIVLVPVCSMLLCLVFTVAGCEVFAAKEIAAKLVKAEKDDGTEPENGVYLDDQPQTDEPETGARRGVSFANTV